MNTIAAVATALNEASTPEFKQYIQQVKKNIQVLGEELVNGGYKITTGGTDNHLCVWDLRDKGVTGSKVEEVCNAVLVYVNKNTVPGDKSALSPGGVRLGSSNMTSRGFKEEEFRVIAGFLMRCVGIAKAIQEEHGSKMVDFRKGLPGNKDIETLKAEVREFSKKFPIPGNYFPN